MTTSTTDLPPVLVAIYDLREDGWRAACRHAALWGSLHTHASYIFADRIAIEFRPSPDPSWRAWEAHRLSQIFCELWPPAQAGSREEEAA
jgi:hypothetical protein